MEFTEIRTHLAKHFKSMVAEADCLFEVNLDKEELWNTYLDSFPPGTNEIYQTDWSYRSRKGWQVDDAMGCSDRRYYIPAGNGRAFDICQIPYDIRCVCK